MSERHTVIPRTMCLIFYDQEVLLMKASDRKDYPGMYDPVGGHIEKGEDIIDSAKREIREETGLTQEEVRLCGIMHVTNFFNKNILMFVCSAISEEKPDIPVHDEGIPQWIPLEDLDHIKTFDDLHPIIRAVLRLKDGQMFTGTSRFTDDGQLLELDIHIH